jgi:hypothetical protein
VQARYGRNGDPADPDEAIALSTLAVDGVPKTDRSRVGHLGDLANSLRLRHVLTGSESDLDDAIRCARAAIGGMTAEQPDRSTIETGLAMALFDRSTARVTSRISTTPPRMRGRLSNAQPTRIRLSRVSWRI